MGSRLTPYQRIVRAAREGRGVRITAREAQEMARDTAIRDLAMNDDEEQEGHEHRDQLDR